MEAAGVDMRATITDETAPRGSMAKRIQAFDWAAIGADLDTRGYAVVKDILAPEDCAALVAFHPHDGPFRSRVVMARHGFGRGEYKYFANPLPKIVGDLRSALYPPLSSIANRWNAAMGVDVCYPDEHERFLERCHKNGQTKPTPLLLRYTEGDYNCLHLDLYGEPVIVRSPTVTKGECDCDGLRITGRRELPWIANQLMKQLVEV
jgi:hypothetical protein